MKADPKRKSHYDDLERAKRVRRHQEEALDDALRNTFPASDPVSITISQQERTGPNGPSPQFTARSVGKRPAEATP